jgi:hypothetical protein
MKKYNTRPIDYTDCHPIIAEHLKPGEAIECKVWDSCRARGGETEEWICLYNGNSNLPYRSESDTPWKHAEQIPIKTRRIMPPERAIPVLIANGWTYLSNGNLCYFGKESIHTEMFSLMGRSVEDPHVRIREWPDCIIEEVDE